jgi:alkylation response protein AidB-like acyl-CoA dehydrogenase
VCEELGATVAPVPFWTSAVAATALSEQLGASGLLAELASGRRVAAVAVPVTDHWSRARSGLRHVDGMLSGQVPMVAGALEADLLLVPLGDTVLLVQAADATIDDVQSLDMTRRLAGITFDEAPAQVVAQGVQVDAAVTRACDVAVSMLASEQLGLANRCLDLTLDYVKIRRQFGRSIGSYQAVKHRIADLWTDISQARATARYAAACAAEGSPDLAVASSVAHSVCSDVALRAAEECVQLHGGIGFTWEHPAHLLLKRARTDALTLGSPTWHRRRLADLAGLTSTTPNKETP